VTKGKRAHKTRKPTPDEQHARFVEAAKKAEADESQNAMDKAFKTLKLKNRTGT
jgi:hypothetical protein